MFHTAENPEPRVVDVFPGLVPRLIAGTAQGRQGLADYRSAGGYLPAGDLELFAAAVGRAGLRGRGGAGYPMALKIAAVQRLGGPASVVANGEEGEPTSVKDRWLMRNRPHLILDGLRLAAAMVGACRTVVYLSDDSSRDSIMAALDELTGVPSWDLQVEIERVDPAFVAGEASAAVQWIDGGPPVPTDKPPRPFQVGVDGRPTLVSNVETLANLPIIRRIGADAYRAVGVPTSPGTFLLTLGGLTTGLFEVPFGVTLNEVLRWRGVSPDERVSGVLIGGYSGGILPPAAVDLPLDHDAVASAFGGLGCGAVIVLGEKICPVAVSASVMAFYARNNAGQCGSCVKGTKAMSGVLDGLRDQAVGGAEVERLLQWSKFLPGRGACQLLDGAAHGAASLLRQFSALVDRHLVGDCGICSSNPFRSEIPFSAADLLDSSPTASGLS